MTANITVTLTDTSGDPLVGARVNAKLFVPDRMDDFIVPENSNVTGTTDAAGQCVLALWPNSANTDISTYYRFRAWHPVTKAKVLDVCGYVDGDASLSEVTFDCKGASAQEGVQQSAALAAHINSANPHPNAPQGGSPAGPIGSIQYNDDGQFGGTGLFWDEDDARFYVTGPEDTGVYFDLQTAPYDGNSLAESYSEAYSSGTYAENSNEDYSIYSYVSSQSNRDDIWASGYVEVAAESNGFYSHQLLSCDAVTALHSIYAEHDGNINSEYKAHVEQNTALTHLKANYHDGGLVTEVRCEANSFSATVDTSCEYNSNSAYIRSITTSDDSSFDVGYYQPGGGYRLTNILSNNELSRISIAAQSGLGATLESRASSGVSSLRLTALSDSGLVEAKLEARGGVGETSLLLSEPYTPEQSISPGTKGMIVWDENYIYVCVSDNVWKRSTLSSW